MKNFLLAPVALAALSICGAVHAQAPQGYFGIQGGNARTNVDCTGTTACDKSDTAFKIYAGFKVAPEWALEVGYTDLGAIKATVPIGGVPVAGQIKATSLGVGAAYQTTFATDWSGAVRFGIASNRAKISVTSGGASASDSESKAKLYLGLGVGYALTKQVSVTGNWDWTDVEYAGERGRVNVLSIGLNYAF